MEKKTAFAREATGLVRSFTWYDSFLISMAVSGPVYIIYGEIIGFITSADPGANVAIVELLGALFMLPLAVLYYLFAIKMPRSGGDYIWTSRVLRPSIGFIGSWAMWIMFLVIIASGAFVWAQIGLPDFFASFGYAWHIPSLVNLAASFSTPTNIFLGSLFLVLICALIASLSPRSYSRIIIVIAGITLLSTFIAIAVVLTTSNQAFANAFNRYAVNATYDGIINQAQSAGYASAPLNWGATLGAIPFGILSIIGFNFAVYAGGEIKDIKKSMLYGTLIAWLVTGILDVVGMGFTMNMIGYNFNGAATFLAGKGTWPLGAFPWVGLLVPAVVTNPVLFFILQLGWLLFDFWWGPAIFLTASRYIFAFSFDRRMPSFFADVNPRFHVPLKAMALNIVVAVIFVYLATYTTYVGAFLNVDAIFAIFYFIVSVAAIVFPYVKKDLASDLPGGRWKVPPITIAGIVSAIVMAVTFYYTYTTPAVGPSTPASSAILVAIFLSGLLIYFGAFYYYKARGIDVGLIGKEIPPE